MSQLQEFCFTPSEFAKLARIDKEVLPILEDQGLIETFRRKSGNVDRKMITLESAQAYFHRVRDAKFQGMTFEPEIGRRGDQPLTDVAAGPQVPILAAEEVQKILDRLMDTPVAHPPHHKKQMFYNVKGGTGKSTLTAQYVMRASMMGYRVLAIDLDAQGHLTLNLDVLDGHELPTIYDVLINDLPIQDAIISVSPGLDLVPASLGLCNIEIPLNSKPRREYRLAEALERVQDQYDLIVTDTNPAASILNNSMLVAADLVNVVCATSPLSFHGMSLVLSTIQQMEKEFRRQLALRIIPNMYDNREVISQEVLGELRSQFSEYCTKTVVNRCADLNEATKRRSTVWSVNARGTAANDIDALTEELLFT